VTLAVLVCGRPSKEDAEVAASCLTTKINKHRSYGCYHSSFFDLIVWICISQKYTCAMGLSLCILNHPRALLLPSPCRQVPHPNLKAISRNVDVRSVRAICALVVLGSAERVDCDATSGLDTFVSSKMLTLDLHAVADC
jgi:hypothetical protein